MRLEAILSSVVVEHNEQDNLPYRYSIASEAYPE